ncbi:MAG: hypothetical protein R3F61_01140 [Myxococcota bacterium]
MGSPAALVVVVAVPAWSGTTAVDAAWDEGVGPVADALSAGRGCAGLVLAGRLVEEWSKRRPDAIRQLRDLLASGRVELLATPLHRPVFSAIPERDAAAQLSAHTTLLKRILGVRPLGAWVPHGVWEPTLPRLLAKGGLEWTLLDREWLADAGAPAAAVLAVEREGRAVRVLPFGESAGTGLRVVRLGAPGGHTEVALDLLDRVSGLPSSLLGAARARAYLPAGGPGGLWERHLLSDAGADALHKRMLGVSRLVRRFETTVGEGRYNDDGPDPHVLQQARRYLHRAQAAEAYAPEPGEADVHGAFRDRAWRDLLRAELASHRALGMPPCDGRQADVDCDGTAEARLWTESWAVTLCPRNQGVLTEISHRESAVNALAGRVPVAFRDAWGDEPAARSWELVTTEPGGDGSMRGVMCADSSLGGVPVRMTKHVHLPARGPMEVRLDIDNRGHEGARGMLSTELNVTLGGPRLEGAEEASLSVSVAGGKVPLDEVIELPPIEEVSIIGWRARMELEPTPAARVRIEPLPQGAARVVLSWPVELWGRERERRSVRLNLREEPHG